MKSKVAIPIIVVGIIALLSMSSANLANAQQSDLARETLIERIATKFGLNKSEVTEMFDEFKQERHQERHQRMEERLEQRLQESVESGDLTEDQMFAMLAKHEELEGRYDDLYDLSPEEMHEARADIHEEMEAWALENDIDMDELDRFGDGYDKEGRMMKGDGSRRGEGGGMYMHR